MSISTFSSLFISQCPGAIVGAQAAVEAETPGSNTLVPMASPEGPQVVVDPLFDFDGFQLQDPKRDEEFNSIQQESVVFRDVQPHEVLSSFNLSQHIKANWEKFKQEHKINI